MTLDDILNIAKTRFTDRRGRAVNESGDCKYRGDTAPCVVGAMITDAEYMEEMEFRDVRQNHKNHRLPDRLAPFVPVLSVLQQIHDRADSWNDDGLLSYPAIKQFNLVAEALGSNVRISS